MHYPHSLYAKKNILIVSVNNICTPVITGMAPLFSEYTMGMHFVFFPLLFSCLNRPECPKMVLHIMLHKMEGYF
jgi:hypothetical protein